MYNDQHELKHYGVLGMKWGVRRNPSTAFRKATKKATKLENKLQKRKNKLSKVGKAYAGFGLASRGDLAGATQRYYSAEKKYQKWKSQMEKTFSGVSVNSIDQDTISRGKQYVDMLTK